MVGRAAVAPSALNEQLVLAKCDYFVDVQLSPLRTTLNARGWLDNFQASERPLAVDLLGSFLYLSDALANSLFEAGFQMLSRRLVAGAASGSLAKSKWQTFFDRCLLTYPTGETPRVTDSGYVFARKARQILQIDEHRILAPQDALAQVMSDPSLPVVFVDDFVGTGWQFEKTWSRRYRGPHSPPNSSFRDHVSRSGGQFFYIPLVCTEHGAKYIETHCPGVSLQPTHMLSPRYSALTADTMLWPQGRGGAGKAFLEEASGRAGIPDDNGKSESDWRGLEKQGLALAFSHSVPDATLPIFYWEENGWTPLIRKT